MKQLLTHKQLAKNSRGLSVLEPLLYMALISVVAIGGVQVLVGLISAEARTNARIVQEADASTTSSWIEKRLSEATTVGQAVDNMTNPLSISGDQLMLETAGYCHRMAYFAEDREISIKSVPLDQCGSFSAIGGPNEEAVTVDNFILNDRDSFISHPIKEQRADGGGAIPVFTYYNEANQELTVDRAADRDSGNVIYDDPQLGETIDSIRVRMIITTPETITVAKPSDIKIDERVYLFSN
jgi:hypothetical protein